MWETPYLRFGAPDSTDRTKPLSAYLGVPDAGTMVAFYDLSLAPDRFSMFATTFGAPTARLVHGWFATDYDCECLLRYSW